MVPLQQPNTGMGLFMSICSKRKITALNVHQLSPWPSHHSGLRTLGKRQTEARPRNTKHHIGGAGGLVILDLVVSRQQPDTII